MEETIEYVTDQAIGDRTDLAIEPLEALAEALAQVDRGTRPRLLAPAKCLRREEEMNKRELELRLYAIAAVSAHRTATGSKIKPSCTYVAKRLTRMGFQQLRSGTGGRSTTITGTTVFEWRKANSKLVLRYADRNTSGVSGFDSAMAALHARHPHPTADQVLACALRSLGIRRGRKGE